jgi:hypothetical protein
LVGKGGKIKYLNIKLIMIDISGCLHAYHALISLGNAFLEGIETVLIGKQPFALCGQYGERRTITSLMPLSCLSN